MPLTKQQRAWEWTTSQIAYGLVKFVEKGTPDRITETHINNAKVYLTELGQWDKVCAKARLHGVGLHEYTTI